MAKQLKADEVAIEFIATPRDFFNQSDTRYGALVLRNDGMGPRYVDLCPSEDVVHYFRDVIHTDTMLINSLYAESDSRLYHMLWQPLEPMLHDATSIYYTPVGVLSLINHDALYNTDHRQLGKRFQLRQLTTTADIATVKSRQWRKPQRAVVYGGITYDESCEEMLAAAKTYQNRIDDGSVQLAQRSLLSRGAITELEGTREEAVYAHKVLTAVGCHTSLLTDQEANEESVKALHRQAPDLLHLGTHGFMLSTNQDQQQHRSLFEQAAVTGYVQQAQMLCSGLLMAGAYRAWHGERIPEHVEDGILTAFELSQVDLIGCHLAVLSACETGHGFINDTTGDIGLKRALKLAGVEQIVVSLWEVPDKATSLLMQTFYDNIANGQQPVQALATARNAVRSGYPQPYYWAGFVLVE